MASLFDLMTPAPTGISGVKEIVSRIDQLKFGGNYTKPVQPALKTHPSPVVTSVKTHLRENTIVEKEEIESPSPRTTIYTCDSESAEECSSQKDFADELPEMLDDIPKDIKQPKQPRAKNKAHDISKLFFHLSKAFEIIGDLNAPYGLNERDA